MPEELKQTIYSIQTVYNLYWDGDVARKTMNMPCALRCRETIKVPILENVSREYNNVMYDVIPVIALVIENDFKNPALPRLKFIIETNEGITVEPLVIEEYLTVYKGAYLFVLPRGIKGIKNVRITIDDNFAVANDLTFDVMESPYNYENYLLTLLSNQFVLVTNSINRRLTSLESRVAALERKAGS